MEGKASTKKLKIPLKCAMSSGPSPSTYFAPNVLLACAIVDRYDPTVDGFRS